MVLEHGEIKLEGNQMPFLTCPTFMCQKSLARDLEQQSHQQSYLPMNPSSYSDNKEDVLSSAIMVWLLWE